MIDIDHDPHARAAIEGYAEDCQTKYPKLAEDLWKWLEDGTWTLDTET